mmetsp:Transcript_30323/g.68549  ORF Transcript_30323/g.68549 Transcript_30323/m.68549 type:complete len:202 (+) Transcript_30323:399-1004(+)
MRQEHHAASALQEVPQCGGGCSQLQRADFGDSRHPEAPALLHRHHLQVWKSVSAQGRTTDPLPERYQLAQTRQVRHYSAHLLLAADHPVPGLLRRAGVDGDRESPAGLLDESLNDHRAAQPYHSLHRHHARRCCLLPRQRAATARLLLLPQGDLQLLHSKTSDLVGQDECGQACRHSDRVLREAEEDVCGRRAQTLPLHPP